jgi:hypothetical protein
VRDAAERARAGDNRLRMLMLMLIVFGQEGTTKLIPGVFAGPLGGMGIRDQIVAKTGDRSGGWRVCVMVSPQGRLWTDPWGRLKMAAGVPPSADACRGASEA